MRWKSHVRCGAGEKTEIISKSYLSLSAGQLIYYLVSQSEAKNKTQGLVTPFLELSTSTKLKQAIITMYKKYGYKIDLGAHKINNLIGMVTGYETQSKASDYQDLIISGICSKNIIYAGKKEEE